MQSRAWAITWRKWLLLAAFVTTTGVYSLPAQTPQDAEIARAARHFRRQVYLNYRTNRSEFDRRRAAAEHAERAYRDAGASVADAERLRDWLLAAAAASGNGHTLPGAPEFGRSSGVVEAPPRPARMSDEPLGPSPSAAAQVAADADEVTTLEVPTVVITDDRPANPQDPTSPTTELSTDAVEHTAGDDVPHAPNSPTESIVTEPAIGDRGHASPPDVSSEPPAVTAEPADIASTEAPAATANAAEEEPAAATTPAESTGSGVNLQELAARVSGHNFAVQGMLLDWGPGAQGDVEQLAAAVEQTAALSRRYGLLRTYVELLSPREKGQVGALEELDRVFTALADAIADLRERVESVDSSGEDRQATVARLNELSRRLADAYHEYEAQPESTP